MLIHDLTREVRVLLEHTYSGFGLLPPVMADEEIEQRLAKRLGTFALLESTHQPAAQESRSLVALVAVEAQRVEMEERLGRAAADAVVGAAARLLGTGRVFQEGER